MKMKLYQLYVYKQHEMSYLDTTIMFDIAPTDLCLLNNKVEYYHFVAQGKTSIPGVDDNEEMMITDVRLQQL